jgi:hypothetical protein
MKIQIDQGRSSNKTTPPDRRLNNLSFVQMKERFRYTTLLNVTRDGHGDKQISASFLDINQGRD